MAASLRADVRTRSSAAFVRVAELINRTNQFNTTACRTSLRQVREWAASADRRILVAQARDEFGTIGIISALVVQVTPESAQVSAISLAEMCLRAMVFVYGEGLRHYLDMVDRYR